MNDGDEFAVGDLTLRVVHTPGHTLGSVCIHIPQERALFTGDTALGLGTVAISPPPHGDMALYLESLDRLKTLDSALMLPGHGQEVHDVPAKLQELIDHRRSKRTWRSSSRSLASPNPATSGRWRETGDRGRAVNGFLERINGIEWWRGGSVDPIPIF